MQPVFEHALSPPSPVCFGLRLRPLTLGHCHLLARLGSPFFAKEPQAKSGDLFVAVLACAQPWRDSERDLRRWWLGLFCLAWGWRCRRMNLATELRKFDEYLSESLKPATFRIPQKSRSLSAPWYMRLTGLLMSEFHYSREQALSTPVPEATSLICSLHEARGDVELWSDDDDEFWQWAQEQNKMREAARQQAKN